MWFFRWQGSRSRSALLLCGLLGLLCAEIWGQPIGQTLSLEEVVRRFTASESALVQEMSKYRPVLETYVQFLREGPDGREQLNGDAYFIGNLDVKSGVNFEAFLAGKPQGKGLGEFLRRFSRVRLLPRGFAQMAVLDGQSFTPANYDFEYVRGEFLGEVRCLVFDVQPKAGQPEGRFVGRIWVEDREFNIVRFSGTYTSERKLKYFHFNSYRQHVGPGQWLPSMVFVQESLSTERGRTRTGLKGHVRLWGYAATMPGKTSTFTTIEVEAPQPATDRSETELSRAQALREWRREAADNALARMEKAGLLGQPGEIEKILDTVVNNLLVTNNLALDPPVSCRVLLTTPLESFVVGNTILLSRGLIDVLPNEASLAAAVARELASLALDHRMETITAFNDVMMFDDAQILKQLTFRRTPAEEAQANEKALELLTNSPYKDQLGSAGQFLAALAERARQLPSLTRAQIGNPVAENAQVTLIPALAATAPSLNGDAAQPPALPLASRLRLDPWDNSTELLRTQTVARLSPSEAMYFEVTPLLPALKRVR